MILALAFVPVPDVPAAFDELVDEVDDSLLILMEYFNLTYVNERKRQGRRAAVPPRYPPVLWNQYDSTMQGLHCTNNSSEGWHNRFNLLVSKSHPDLYAFLAVVLAEQKDVETQLVEVSIGRTVRPAKRRKYAVLQDRLHALVSEYETYNLEGNTLQYLRTVSYNICIAK